MPFVNLLDPATPAAGAFLSEGDDRIRELKLALIERLQTLIVDINTNPLAFIAGIIPTAALANGAVSTLKIADDAVTALKIADAAVADIHLQSGIDGHKLVAGSVGTAELADESVTFAKLFGGTAIPPGSITGTEIAADVVDETHLTVNLRNKTVKQSFADYALGAITPLNTNTNFESANIAIAGAALGDVVVVGMPPGTLGFDAPNRLLNYYGFVSSAGNVRLRIQNNSGGPANVPADTVRLMVLRRYTDWYP